MGTAQGSAGLEAADSVAVAVSDEVSHVATSSLPGGLSSPFEQCYNIPGSRVDTEWLHGQTGSKKWPREEHGGLPLEGSLLNLVQPAVLVSDSEAIPSPPAASSASFGLGLSPMDDWQMSFGDVALQVYLLSTLRAGSALRQRASNIYRAVHLSSSSTVLFTRLTYYLLV